jgi:hypothetical protein
MSWQKLQTYPLLGTLVWEHMTLMMIVAHEDDGESGRVPLPFCEMEQSHSLRP